MKKYFFSQSFFLFIGTLFAWSTVVSDFIRFAGGNGVNPVITPCFYGAIGFLVFYIYSLFIYFANITQQKKNQKILVAFLVAGTLFGWGNFILEICRFYWYNNPTSCSGVSIETPFATPCFYGSVLYLLSLAASFVTLQFLRHLSPPKK